jgi:urea transport system substrate-binding protein
MEKVTRRVLVVEDDADLRELTALVLTAAGFLVTLAANGREALRHLERGLPDLVLLDMRMPVMDGWEFARQFRDRHGQVTPIVVVTAAQEAATRAAEVGAAGYVSKPFDIDVLVAAVRSIGSRGPEATAC